MNPPETKAPAPRSALKRWPLIAGVAVVLAGVWGLRKYNEARVHRRTLDEAQRRAAELPQVKAYKVRPRNITGALKRVGTIRARAETNLQFGTPGRVAKFDVEKGQFVKKGTLLAALDQEEAKNFLKAAELEYQKAATKYFTDRTIDRLEFERAKTKYNQARLEASKTTIRAPHDGYLVEKWVNVGEQADAGTVVGKVVDKSRVSVEMDLSEDDIQYLKTGQSVEITVDAVPGFKTQGTVASVTPYLKGDSRSFQVKVDLPGNPQEALNPGMFARCTVRRYEKAGALVVPLEAGASLEESKISLFVVDDQNIAHAKTLPVLFMDEGQVEVEGLSDGEAVILHPGPEIQEGSRVRLMGVLDPAALTEPPAASTPTASSPPL
jgi:membrane fusion protein, multidrug efflux system